MSEKQPSRSQPEQIVYVVDDDPGMRKSMCMALQSAQLPVRPFASAEEFLDGYAADTPGSVVLDLSMPGMSGLELLKQLRAQGIELPVVVVSGTATVPSAIEAMKLGVVDFLQKPVDHRLVVQKVQDALAKDALKRASAAEVEAIRQRLAALTDRERQLLRLVINGRSNKQIADDMGISIKTVANHRAHLMEKSGALNAADLVRISMLAGLH